MRKVYDNPYNCPVTKTVEFIGGKWKPIILNLLTDGAVRFGKLTVFMPTISRKMLSQQLRELEEDGLIIKISYSEKPPRVEYKLSGLGETVIPVLRAMGTWGMKLLEETDTRC